VGKNQNLEHAIRAGVGQLGFDDLEGSDHSDGPGELGV
jgi:hypothetical protein